MSTLFPSLVGATCTAKTEVACLVARHVPIEVVGADSRQIYRGFDAGTAKPTASEQERVPHHLVDVADPGEGFSAARFAELAHGAAEEIRARHHVPFLVGGSGLYVRATLRGLFEGPAASPDVRRRLVERARTEGASALHAELARVDGESARRLHPSDVVRVVRALEVRELTGEPLSAHHARHRARTPRTRGPSFGLAWETEVLVQRIEARVQAMLASGWIEEVQALLERGIPDDAPAWNALGYGTVRELVRGRISREEAQESIVRATRQLAKRQRTWFRAVPEVVWIPIGGVQDLEPAARKIAEGIVREAPGGGT